MLRQASSRNQRAKGFRLKHALQIGILVAICIWLVYQVKHSHEKKSAYDATNSKLINKATDNQEDFFKFGRKDLRNEPGAISEIQKEEEAEEAQEEGEPEVKQEKSVDGEVRGAGDNAIDDQDRENNEKAERGENSSDNPNHERGTQAAREENYNRDDASSAVVHDDHTTGSETVNVDARSMTDEQIVEHSKVDNDSATDGSKVDGAGKNLEKKETVAENVTSKVDGSTGDSETINSLRNNVSDLLVKDNDTKTDDSLAKNGTTAENKESYAETSKADNGLISNSTNTTIASTESNIQVELPSNSTSASGNQIEGQNNSTLFELDRQVEMSNSTVNFGSVRDGNATNEKGTSREVESNVVDPIGKPNSIAMPDLKDRENSTSSATENGDDTTTSSSTNRMEKEERDNLTDLSNLPNIQNEAKTTDKEATE